LRVIVIAAAAPFGFVIAAGVDDEPVAVSGRRHRDATPSVFPRAVIVAQWHDHAARDAPLEAVATGRTTVSSAGAHPAAPSSSSVRISRARASFPSSSGFGR